MVCNPIAPANEVYDGLVDDADFEIPNLEDIQFPSFPAVDNSTFLNVPTITVGQLTERKVNGSGVFDALMQSVTAHIDRERGAGRITNNDFAKAYVEFSTAALNGAIQFLLQKDQAQWAALAAQTQAKLAIVELTRARVELEKAKMEMKLLSFQANQAKVDVARGKMALATARVEYCTAEYQLENMLPKQSLILDVQKEQLEAQIDQMDYTTTYVLPEQMRLTKAQADGAIYTTTYMLPKQVDQLTHAIELIKEQAEAQRAQTLDVRKDGSAVTGSIGKQKELHSQQIISFQRDAELKAARPFIDAWITMKTIDEGTLPPTNFNMANLDQVLTILRTNNDLI